MNITFTNEMTVDLVQHMGGDKMVVAAARVSTRGQADATPYDKAEAEGLINYLMKHRHGTPFEHGALSFFIHAPIFVWREFHRHRIGFSYNEESARYKTLEPVFFVPSRERAMMKVDGWKPGRPKFASLNDWIATDWRNNGQDQISSRTQLIEEANGIYNEIIDDMKSGYEDEYARYIRQIERLLDPGLARDNLPVGIYSSCWVTCNPRSIMAFLSLRTHDPEAKFVSYPLAEIEDVARKMEALFAEHWPLTHKAFCDNGRVGP